MIRNPKDLQRYTAGERVNHWVVGMSFILLALSGLAFFHPAFFPLTLLFGGGTWTRILHPFLGLLFALAFAGMFTRFRELNRITQEDRAWLSRIGEMVEGNDHNMPEQGKYNGGQKLMFWSLATCAALLFITGLMLWRAYFPNVPTSAARTAAVVHAAVAALMIAVVFIHVYAAIWTKGTFRAMWYGTVTRAWAKQHHRAWYREMTGKM